MKDANKRPRIFLPLSKRDCGPHEITSKEIRLHWTFSANWNKQGLKKREFILKVTYSLSSPLSMLLLPIYSGTAGDARQLSPD